MSELNLDYISDLRREMLDAIYKVTADRQGEAEPGEPAKLYIGAAEVCQALTMLLAEFIEGGPGLNTPGDVRRMSETISKKLRTGIAEIRRARETAGEESPPVAIINRH